MELNKMKQLHATKKEQKDKQQRLKNGGKRCKPELTKGKFERKTIFFILPE
jgi:hypothetical protein